MIDILDISSISRVCDWVELNVVFFNERISKSKLISILEENDFEPDHEDYWDEFFDSLVQELNRRSLLYGADAPFIVVGSLIEPNRNWIDCPEYILCLYFSYWGAENAPKGTKLFERICNETLKSYLQGNAITLGFPNEDSLSDQLDELATLLFEQRGNRNPATSDKDRGVDVVGWKEFADQRNSQLIILMQCAAGRTWKKKKQIPLPAWAQYIHWNFQTTVPSMAVTEIVENKQWQNRVDEYGIIFDRSRIYKNIYNAGFEVDAALRTEVIEWCETNLN